MNSNDNLIIIASNDANSKLYDWSQNCIGKNLYEVMEKERADRLYLRFYEWKKSGLIAYFAYFEDDPHAWETTIEVVNDTLFGIGKKVDDKKIKNLSFEKYEFFNHFDIQPEDYINVILSVKTENLIIESVDTNFVNDFDRFKGKDVSSLTFFCSNIIDKHVYHKAFQTREPVQYVEKYVREGNILYFDVVIYPYINNSKIFIHAKKIDEHLYRKAKKNISNMSGMYPAIDSLSICELSYEDENKPFIIGNNYYFNELIEETNILAHIIDTIPFQKCAENLSTTAGDLSFINYLGESKKYRILVSHIPNIGKHIFIVVLTPEEQYINNINDLFSDLSNREKEVITYVADGLTNRYIANKLSITEGTVKRTIYNSYKKLEICSRIELLKMIYHE